MDIIILNFIQNHFHNGFTDWIFPYITAIGDYGLIWVLAGLCLLVSKKYRRDGIILLAVLAVTHIIGEMAIKPLVARPRPFVTFPGHRLLIPPPSGFSFPSGHAASSFAAAFTLWKTNKNFGIPAFIMASLIAFSRVFLFVHYPSDILCGAILGVLISYFILVFLKNNEKTTKM